MTDPTPASSTHPAPSSWLYRALAVTGIAVGLFVIAAGAYLLFGRPDSAHSPQQDCCKSMEADMKKMMDDPKMPMNKAPMPTMAPMPSMSPMPGPTSMPGIPAPRP